MTDCNRKVLVAAKDQQNDISFELVSIQSLCELATFLASQDNFAFIHKFLQQKNKMKCIYEKPQLNKRK